MADDIVPQDAALFWQSLKASTPARIGLSSAGSALSTRDHLAFQLAHAQARDAVQVPLDIPALRHALESAGISTRAVRSRAASRQEYLARPDLGRQLHPSDVVELSRLPTQPSFLFVIADGLSAQAVNLFAVPLVGQCLPLLAASGWTVGEIVLAEQARVAIGDGIAAVIGASMVAVLIGERPGLSSPASLGAYMTWKPHAGSTDAERNCISNIHAAGMGTEEAAQRLVTLSNRARELGATGVQLKDEWGTGRALESAGGASDKVSSDGSFLGLSNQR